MTEEKEPESISLLGCLVFLEWTLRRGLVRTMPKRAALSGFGLFAFLIVVCLLAAKANRAEKTQPVDEEPAPVLDLKNTSTSYKEISFQLQIKPILAHHCTSCHNPEKRRGGLQLTN